MKIGEYEQMMSYLTRPAAETRENFQNGTPSKSAFRKPFSPEIEEKIIKLHQVDKMGAQAIADELGLSRSPVGKRITALKKEGKIKDIPYAERKASIDQRGEFFGKPASEKFQKIREVRDIDRTTRFKDTGELKYDIPKNAKFKIDFKTAGGLTSDIPEDLQGVQYYTTKKQAEKALAKRKKLKLKADVDPDEVKRSANKKKYDLVKEVSNNNIEELLTDFKTGQPLEQAHRLSLQQVKKTGELYNVMNLGLDFDDPNFVQINNEFVKPYENKLKQLYKKQNELYVKASTLKSIPKELRKQIEFNNKQISTVVDLSGGRVQGLQLDEFTLKPKVTGVNYANVLGFGLYDKPVKDLTKIDRAEIGAIMQQQIENEKKTAGKTAKKLFQNTELLKDVDTLSGGPKLKAALLPGLEQIVEGIKNIPDDIKKKKFFTLGLKALGPLGTYIAVDDTYEALKAGRPVAEALEYGLIGTDVIGSAKDLMALSPEEREARSVVKQAEMADQIAQDESMLDSDFETPKVKSDLTDEEAKRKYQLAQERIEAENKANEAKIARARAISMSGLKDLITGKRFAGQEMPTQYMAVGGRIGFADGPDDPSRRKFMKIAGGIASIPLVGKYLKPAMVAAPKVVEVVKRSADGMPDFIGDLITKVVTFGKKSFSGNRADELAENYELDNYVVTQQGNKTTIKKVDDQGEFGYKENEMELEMDPETGGVTYNEASVRPDAEGKLKDVEEFIDDVDLEDMKKYTYDE